MCPKSWGRALGAIVGIFCLWATLWAVPELLIDYFTEPYRGGTVDIASTSSLVIGFLVLGSIGMSLITGEFYDHGAAFTWAWVITGLITSILFVWSFSQIVGVR